MESFSGLVVNKLKDAYSWVGEITLDSSIGTWIGEVPEYLKESSRSKATEEHIATGSSLLEKLNEDAKASAQDIATYQVISVKCVKHTLFHKIEIFMIVGSLMEAGSVIARR